MPLCPEAWVLSGDEVVSKMIDQDCSRGVLFFCIPSLETPGELADLINLGASLDVVRSDLGGDGLVAGARQTVHSVVIASRPNIADLIRKLPIRDTELVVVVLDCMRQRAKVFGGEDAALVELSRVEGLVPPRQGPVEAALVAQKGLEGRDEGAVPGEEDFVPMDGVGEDLVGFREVLPPALGGGEVFAGRGLLGQARDGIHEGLAVAGRVVAPLNAGGERCAACRIGSARGDSGG